MMLGDKDSDGLVEGVYDELILGAMLGFIENIADGRLLGSMLGISLGVRLGTVDGSELGMDETNTEGLLLGSLL